MPAVDAHIHVFTTRLNMTPNRRYTPPHDATPEQFAKILMAHDVPMAVIVQPSFLGVDNSYLVEALEDRPDMFRGIAVVDPFVSDRELEAMDAAGVVGIRFNLVGRDPLELESPDVRSLLRRIEALRWHVQVQVHGRHLPDVYRSLAAFGGPIVFDHFGLPDPNYGLRDPGFRLLFTEGPRGRIFVKFSAGYRCGIDVKPYAEMLLARLGPQRIVWGSDWPWTQFETVNTYANCIRELTRLAPDPQTREAIDRTATGLYRFSEPHHQLLWRQIVRETAPDAGFAA